MDKTELLALADRLQTQYEKRELPSWDEIHVAASALRRLAAAEPGEPGAWRYELSSAIGPSGNYLGWRWYLTETKPNVPEGSIRNLTPLYTRPQPAPAFGEGVEIKPLGWRGPISAYPTTIWEAKTPFGHYVIEEVSASDSPAYEVRFAGSLVSVKDDVNDAKDAAQTDYEKRVRSSVSTISVDESVDRVLSELRDRRLLNDVDDDLHQEIAIALIKAVWPLTQLRAPDAPQADQNALEQRDRDIGILLANISFLEREAIARIINPKAFDPHYPMTGRMREQQYALERANAILSSGLVQDEAKPLTADCQQLLPGGCLDDSTYEKIESALDKIEAPMRSTDGRWLGLHERIAAIRSRSDGGEQG